MSMARARYGPLETADARELYTAVNSTPQDKQTIIKVLADTFAKGMATQAALTKPGRDSVPAAR